MSFAFSPRWATVVLAVAVLVTAAACGDDDDARSDLPADSTAAPATAGEATGTTTPPATTGGETSLPAADGVTVTIKTFDFQPDPLTVKAGTKITFTNEDKIEHTVTSGTREQPTPDTFDGMLDGQGTTFELTLDEPGTYEYFCSRHNGPGMTATVVVE